MVKDITVVDTNYTDYALVLKHKVFNREYTQVALYGETNTFTSTFLRQILKWESISVCLCPCTCLQVAHKASEIM